MRTFLVCLAMIALSALALVGCATPDHNAAGVSATTAVDSSAKPGSGPGAPPSSGMPMNTGPQ